MAYTEIDRTRVVFLNYTSPLGCSLLPEHLIDFRRSLSQWYLRNHRKLPWRETRDPYRIWLSEIMLQQTRVAAVLPYYQRFLERFPDVQSLASASEDELLAAWSGLGYYSRARNLQRAAKEIVARGSFPSDYDSILALPGVGDYTAAAVASIAFGVARAVLDGNVLRVLSRITNDSGDISSAKTRERLRSHAGALLDPEAPGLFNQAMMELGATVCLPQNPQCLLCPVQSHCEALKQGTQHELPVKLRRVRAVEINRMLLIIEREDELLLWQRGAESSRLRGFWELPDREQLPKARLLGKPVGSFRHSITHHNYTFTVQRAESEDVPQPMQWVKRSLIPALPASTTLKKALRLLGSVARSKAEAGGT